MSIRLPRLLNDQLQETARLTPLRLSVTSRLFGLSTAALQLPSDAPRLYVRDLVELFDAQGSAGVYRVTDVKEDAGGTRTVSLTHSLCTLQDSMIPSFTFRGTVREALSQLLAHQTLTRWTLGDVETPEDLTILCAAAYTDLYSAVQNLWAMLPQGYAFSFDQQGSTWILHLRALSGSFTCEGRLGRNLRSVRVEMDGSRLCTRVYPFGVEVDHTRISLMPLEGADYLQSEAAAQWGVVSRTFAYDLIFDVPTLKAVAEMYLARHSQPEVVITLDAADLSLATREPLDAFRLGGLCRLALPETGDVHIRRIVQITRPDVLCAPEDLTLTLASHTIQNEDAEIEELLRQVTASKLLGGTVAENTVTSVSRGSYNAPAMHYFTIEDSAAVLDVRLSCQAESGASIRALRVDGLHPPEEVWQSGSFSLMPYLARNELGQIAQGQHWIAYHPTAGSYTDTCAVTSAVTITAIEDTTA